MEAIPKAEELYQTKLEFLGFVGPWNGSRKSKVKFRCKVHGCIFISDYYNFVTKHQINCRECVKIKFLNNSRELTSGEAIQQIDKKILELKETFGLDLEFLGFVDPPESDKIRKLGKIIIRCRKHGEVGKPTFERFMRRGFFCKECTREKNSCRLKLSDEEIYRRLSVLHPEYTFSDLRRDNSETSYGTVSATCPHGHESFRRTLQSFFTDKELHCPTCEALKKTIDRTNRIHQLIFCRNHQFGLHLRFDGFVGGDYIGVRDTRLQLHCNKCNTDWNTTKYDSFVSGQVICGCPICSKSSKISHPENSCNSSLRDILGEDIKIYRQYRIVPESTSTYGSNIFVDFYIPDRNLILEYNGEQHYSHCTFFHKTKEDFEMQISRDAYLVEYCIKHGIQLLVIPFVDEERINEIIYDFLVGGVDTTTKLKPKY